MKKILLTIFVLLAAAYGVFASRVHSDKTIEHIVLAAYAPEYGEVKDRDVALYRNAREHFRFDENGDVIWQRTFSPSRGSSFSLQTQSVSRDEDGQPLEILAIDDRTEEQRERLVFNYDNAPSEITIQHRNANNNVRAIEIEQYDNRGNIVSREITDTNAGDVRRTSIEYNENDLPVREVRYKIDGSINWIWLYEYDEMGNAIETVMQEYVGKDDYINHVTLSEYDDNNNLILSTWLDENGKEERKVWYEYEYDEQGNWITKKKDEVLNPDKSDSADFSAPVFVWERQINYAGSMAPEMRDKGCIFLENTLMLCENEALDSLRQDTNRHIWTQSTISLDGNDFRSERVYGLEFDLVTDEECDSDCMEHQISALIEEELSRNEDFSLESSQELSLGGYDGSFFIFHNEDLTPGHFEAIKSVFMTSINGRLVNLAMLHTYHVNSDGSEAIVNEMQDVIELNLTLVSEL